MALGEECSEKHICQGPFTTCDGVCKCADEYEPSDNGRWCRLQENWFIGEMAFLLRDNHIQIFIWGGIVTLKDW